MYLYLYDNFLNNSKYSSKLARIETRLTDLGIGGKISRLSPLKNLTELVEEEIKNGIKTIVVVGDDKTLAEVINVVATHKVVLGFIPIGHNSQIAKILGLPPEEKACDVISARKIEKVDLGKINGNYFLNGLKITQGPVTIECDNKYKVAIDTSSCQVNICNLKPLFLAEGTTGSSFNPQDGLLETFIAGFSEKKKIFSSTKDKKETKNSIFPCKKILIKSSKSLPVVADDQRVLKTPVKIEVAPKKIKIIVSKERMF